MKFRCSAETPKWAVFGDATKSALGRHIKKTMGIRRVPSKNDRVKLEMKILRYRKLARQIATDPDTAERIKQLIADLEQELREIDE